MRNKRKKETALPTVKDDPIDILFSSNVFNRREESSPHISYAHEKERYRIVAQGRIDELEQSLTIPPDGTPGRISLDELRNMKNMLITAITLFTRAAMDGGVDEELAYSLSDSYILNGEACKNANDIHQIYLRAYREFTTLVAENKKVQYSPSIEAALRYVYIHLHENITLENTAQAVGISRCYLSRLFKKESGDSFAEYIQKQRIESARHMLIYSKYTTAEISQYLHFSTQSYFIKIFKKYMEMTPEEYKKRYRKTTGW